VLAFLSIASAASIASRARATELATDPVDPNAPPPPPPPMPATGSSASPTPAPAPTSTEAKLEQASKDDSGVGLHFLYIQPAAGLGWATLGGVLPSGTQSGVGPSFGVHAGAELIALQLGARFEALPTSNWNLYDVSGEIAYQPGSGRFWPRIGVAVGYAWAGNWSQSVCAASCSLLDVHGLDLGLRAGFQYYLGSRIEIGADAAADALVLSRSKIVGGPAAFADDGNSVGFGVRATVHLGWHYP
jgi:hypothetical protein